MQIHDVRLREIMDEVLKMGEHAHQLMVDLSTEAGFYRKRVCDIAAGDVVSMYRGDHGDEWALVFDVTSTCTPEGIGVYEIRFVDDNRVLTLDPADIVDVKAEPIQGAF